tara:strand:+ start:377 stop:592 length:216 start_codon:yes stop_codon:yes gene_type:complete
MPRKLIRPNIPPDSCNHIDRVIELADAMINETDSEMCVGYYNIIKEEAELVRTINTQLRAASKFWYGKYKQ